jgi:defect-in-organelle-trafficking protein DotC
MIKKRYFFVQLMGLLLVCLLCGCAKTTRYNINALQDLTANTGTTRLAPLRTQGLREAALSVGARGGLAWRAREINLVLLQNESMLYRLFNFNAMLLDKNILPPVLTEGRNTLHLAGSDVIRLADRTFQILTQARFVTAPPTWRDYLWLSYSTPEIPDKSLLPRTREERFVWKKFILEGWKAGMQQAELIYKENLGRLKRDYEGMIRYRSLLAQNMVSPPFVGQLDMGVTGGGSDLTVNDRILRITALPALQADSRNWKTEIIPHE